MQGAVPLDAEFPGFPFGGAGSFRGLLLGRAQGGAGVLEFGLEICEAPFPFLLDAQAFGIGRRRFGARGRLPETCDLRPESGERFLEPGLLRAQAVGEFRRRIRRFPGGLPLLGERLRLRRSPFQLSAGRFQFLPRGFQPGLEIPDPGPEAVVLRGGPGEIGRQSLQRRLEAAQAGVPILQGPLEACDLLRGGARRFLDPGAGLLRIAQAPGHRFEFPAEPVGFVTRLRQGGFGRREPVLQIVPFAAQRGEFRFAVGTLLEDRQRAFRLLGPFPQSRGLLDQRGDLLGRTLVAQAADLLPGLLKTAFRLPAGRLFPGQFPAEFVDPRGEQPDRLRIGLPELFLASDDAEDLVDFVNPVAAEFPPVFDDVRIPIGVIARDSFEDLQRRPVSIARPGKLAPVLQVGRVLDDPVGLDEEIRPRIRRGNGKNPRERDDPRKAGKEDSGGSVHRRRFLPDGFHHRTEPGASHVGVDGEGGSMVIPVHLGAPPGKGSGMNGDGRSHLLGEQVLVLNRFWQAVNVCSVRRAFALLYTGRAQVVFADDGSFSTFGFEQWMDFSRRNPGEEFIRTISLRLRVPRVILLLFFDRVPKKDVKFSRSNVFERDRNICQYCGRRFDRRHLTIDHVVPRDRGGETIWTNVVSCCVPCNSRKRNRLPEEAGMRLIRHPYKPRWRPFVQISVRQPVQQAWRHFLDPSSWNVELGDDGESAA